MTGDIFQFAGKLSSIDVTVEGALALGIACHLPGKAPHTGLLTTLGQIAHHHQQEQGEANRIGGDHLRLMNPPGNGGFRRHFLRIDEVRELPIAVIVHLERHAEQVGVFAGLRGLEQGFGIGKPTVMQRDAPLRVRQNESCRSLRHLETLPGQDGGFFGCNGQQGQPEQACFQNVGSEDDRDNAVESTVGAIKRHRIKQATHIAQVTPTA